MDTHLHGLVVNPDAIVRLGRLGSAVGLGEDDGDEEELSEIQDQVQGEECVGMDVEGICPFDRRICGRSMGRWGHKHLIREEPGSK